MAFLTRTLLTIVVVLTASGARAGGVTPFVDLLVWQASEETSAVWSSVITPGPLTPSTESTFAAAGVQFDWNAGLRTGLAIKPDGKAWDAKLAWTYFPSSFGSASGPGDQLIIPEFFSGFLSGDAFSFTGATVDWKLNFHTIDLESGYEFNLTESLLIRPALGLKAAIIDQKIRSTWTNPTTPLSAIENVDHRFWGIGPSFSLGMRWNVPRSSGLSFVGSLTGALMWGTWNVTDTYERLNPVSIPNTYRTFTTEINDSSLGTVTLRYFVGLEWTRRGRFPLAAQLGYEMQWWANQQRLPTFQQLPMHGDLTLQGATCGISVSF